MNDIIFQAMQLLTGKRRRNSDHQWQGDWWGNQRVGGRVTGRADTVNQASTTRWPNVGLMLAQRRRRWANINPALGVNLVFAYRPVHPDLSWAARRSGLCRGVSRPRSYGAWYGHIPSAGDSWLDDRCQSGPTHPSPSVTTGIPQKSVTMKTGASVGHICRRFEPLKWC